MRKYLSAGLFLVASAASAAKIPMYDFPLKNSDRPDSVYKMSEHSNSVFVFEAYRLSCVYCNQNAPAVDELATEFAGNARVQVLDLGLDTAQSDFDEWISTHSPNHPVIQDTGRRVYNAFKTENAIPQVFVVNCKGELVGNHVGTWDGATRKIHNLITTALATTCAK